jgi:hypothetical protein
MFNLKYNIKSYISKNSELLALILACLTVGFVLLWFDISCYILSFLLEREYLLSLPLHVGSMEFSFCFYRGSELRISLSL